MNESFKKACILAALITITLWLGGCQTWDGMMDDGKAIGKALQGKDRD